MEELSFKLEIFEGPLDLMLSLIAKHKLNIRDIEISILLEQFLLYLDKMQEHEVEELKKELTGRLIEYAVCKAAAERLRRHYVGDSVFVREPLELPVDNTYRNNHDKFELLESYSAVSTRSEKLKNDAKQVLKPIVAQTFVSVVTTVMFVLRKLKNGEQIEVNSLYRGQKRSEQVAVFLALLELSKHGRVMFSEDGDYITIQKRTERVNEAD